MNFDNMKKFMNKLTDMCVPGNSISVSMNGKVVFEYQSGYSDLENKISMNGEELFNIYSCSKVTTVTAAMQLYEKGYFLLDDPLYDIIPDFKDMYVKRADGSLEKASKPITMRHLFTMTSGLNYATVEADMDEVRKSTNGAMNTIDVVKTFAKKTLCFNPGESWTYGLNHDVLAAVVEVISGLKFRDYVEKNIFAPLGMTTACYHNESVRDKMAEQYKLASGGNLDIVKMQSSGNDMKNGLKWKIENVGKSAELIYGSEYDSGGAGITCSVSDYAKLCAALASKGVGATGEKILSPGSIELMRTDQLTQEQKIGFNWQQHKGYGYGLGVRTMIDRAQSGSNGSFGEFGWGGAAGATVIVDPNIGLSAFYSHHMLNPQEEYYQPRLRNVLYSCL